MAKYRLKKASTFLGMGDKVFAVVNTAKEATVAYVNEKAQIVFTKPINLNVAQEVIEFAIDKIENQEEILDEAA